jgi:acetyl-CoA C-acetyltransferase
MRDVVIVSAARTPVGSFNGVYKDVPAWQLGATAIRAAVTRAGIADDAIDEVILGCVLPAGLGQAPARIAMIKAGLPAKIGALTINKVCGSGLKAVGLAVQAIQAGDADVVVAGGMESMSLGPHLLPKSRQGYRMGNYEILDHTVYDGLWDSHHGCHMGQFAENTAEKFGITRERLDAFAIESYKRAQAAIAAGEFKEEIAPVSIPQKKGDPVVVDTDEEPGKANFAKIPTLPSAFRKGGVVTAANASSINDGAAAVVVMSAEKAKTLGLKPLVKVLGQANGAQAPEWFTTAPVVAMQKLFAKTKTAPADYDLYEINQAFSVVSLYTIDHFQLDTAKVDVCGGAVAIGHPIGGSGARILTTLLYAMKRRGAKRGMACLCIGGGEGFAMAFEAV